MRELSRFESGRGFVKGHVGGCQGKVDGSLVRLQVISWIHNGMGHMGRLLCGPHQRVTVSPTSCHSPTGKSCSIY